MKNAHFFCPRFAVLFLVFASCLHAQSGPPADLDAYVARDMKTFDVPGIAIAIVKDGKVVLAKGYGVRKLGDATPVDENTLFGIGSNHEGVYECGVGIVGGRGENFLGRQSLRTAEGFRDVRPLRFA
jgi:Beta-lactamase